METRKIKILEAIRQGKIGGGETHVLELVSKIDKNVFEPVVLSFTDGPMVDQLRASGIKVYVIETESGFDRRVWGRVKDLMREEKIDIVHAHGTRANSNVFMSARKLKLPLVYTVHGWSFHPDQNPLIRFARKVSERFLTAMSDSVICVSESNMKDGTDGWNMKRATVIYNGINTKKFDPLGKYSDIRKEFSIPAEKTLIGYVVRITKQKDPMTLIRAMKKISEQSKDIILLMVGEGDLKESAQKLSEELGLSSNIIFENFRQDVPDILNAIDIYCLPSLWEGLPIGVLEAMSMAKVCIATPVDGTREIISSGENGILVPVQNESALADAILKVHNDPEFRKKISANAVRTIQEKFSIEAMVKKIEDHYRFVLHQG
jgi:glycosyltransferase involved in cell wall biosynthesis